MTCYRMTRLLLLASLCVVVAPTLRAHADSAVALALDATSGAEVEPFSELWPGDAVELADAGTVEFLHYPTCKEVVVTGGRLHFSAQSYTVQQGQIVDVRRADCPQTIALSEGTGIGGVLVRDLGNAVKVRLGSASTLVMAGSKGGAVAQARVLRDDRVIYEGAVEDRRFTWPQDIEELGDDATLTLELLAMSGESVGRVDLDVLTRARGKAMTLIRID